jgi:hypothetical protein
MIERYSPADAMDDDDRLMAMLRLTELLAPRSGDRAGCGDRLDDFSRDSGEPTAKVARRRRRVAWAALMGARSTHPRAGRCRRRPRSGEFGPDGAAPPSCRRCASRVTPHQTSGAR